MEGSLIPQINHGIMDEEDEVGTPPSSSSGDSRSSHDSSEFMEDATSSSSSSSSSTSSSSPPSSKDQVGPLYEMSPLMAQLPFKRGLSKHFHGKSQSFTSLLDVRCVEDLAKPEGPCRKKLKPCKSYGGGLDAHKPLSPKACWSRAISKKPSRGTTSSSSPLVKRRGFLGSHRPPIAPHRSSSFSAHSSLLFA